MDPELQKRLGMFDSARCRRHLLTIRRGIERETLRVDGRACPSMSRHPEALGAPLTHATVTTDFSEALLELITPPVTSVERLMSNLRDIHRCVARALPADEWLWAGSIPGKLEGEDSVPIAHYGQSNSALMKAVYRRGLAERYGRYMQAIAGIHYNFSMPPGFWSDYARAEGAKPGEGLVTRSYMALVRNCHRDAWLLVYLLGASPVVPEYFARRQQHYQLSKVTAEDYGLPHATSLRLSRIGYQSVTQHGYRVRTNCLSEYIADLCSAILEDFPGYEHIGLKRNGEYVQLGLGLLQIENEHYGVVRPKQSVGHGVPPLRALQQHGIEYVELRCLDLNPEHALGVDSTTLYFLDTFLLRCLLGSSPPLSEEDDRCSLERLTSVVERGRDPETMLRDGMGYRSVANWGKDILSECMLVAEVLDAAQGCTAHLDACKLQVEKLDDPAKTPSARMLQRMSEEKNSYLDHVLERSRGYTEALRSEPLSVAARVAFDAECSASIQRRKQLERKQREQDFAAYREGYYRAYRETCSQNAELTYL